MDELKLEHRLSDVESRAKSNTHRLDELEKKQDEMTDLVQAVAIIAQKQADMDGDVREIKQDVKGLLAVPAKRWEKVTVAAVSAAVTAAVTAVAALLLR